MTLMQAVFFFHRSSTPTAREIFFSLTRFCSFPHEPSQSFSFLLIRAFPIRFSFLLPSAFCVCLLPSLLLSAFCFPPFLLSEPSAQEHSSSLLSRAGHECFSLPFCFIFTSAFFPSSHKPSSPPIGLQPMGWGGCMTSLVEIATPF